MSSSLRFHQEGGKIARLVLDHPTGYPRLNSSLLRELRSTLQRLWVDARCKGIVIHGSEKCFAAGAEVSEVGALGGASALEFAQGTQLFFQQIAGAPKPVVAALTGYCLGGGFDLALSCHWRLASPHAVLGHPGATLGLLTGWGGTQRLPRLIGRAQALELLLAGMLVDAQRGLRLGIVDEIVPAESLLARALDCARHHVELRAHALPGTLHGFA